MSESTQRLVRRIASYVLLWLLAPIGAQVGLWIFRLAQPNAVASPGTPPPSLLYGVIGLIVGVIAAMVLSWRLKFGIIWFAIALAATALLSVLAIALPPAVMIPAFLLVPPVIAALVARRYHWD